MIKGTDYIGNSVIFLCHDGKDNFVMAKCSKNTRDERGMWDCGSGSLEFGESVEDRLRTEIKEEYCAEVLDYEFLGFGEVHRTYNGKPTHWIALYYKVLVDPQEVKLGEPDKFEELGCGLLWIVCQALSIPSFLSF